MKLDYTNIRVLQDAFLMLFNNNFLSDIKFKFSDERIIFAHSFVLCCRSDQFREAFEANFGATKMIDVTDYTYEEYYEFLRYLYTDASAIKESNAGSLLLLSKKHELRHLETKCADIMVKDMTALNVCTTLERCIEFGSENLTKKCTEFIAKNYFKSLSTESFLKVNDKTLNMILKLNPVSDTDEFKLFELTMKWALAATGGNPCANLKREKLGENLSLIRFGAMTVAEFAKCETMEPDLLTKDESLSIFRNLAIGTKGLPEIAYTKRFQLPIEDDTNWYHLFDPVVKLESKSKGLRKKTGNNYGKIATADSNSDKGICPMNYILPTVNRPSYKFDFGVVIPEQLSQLDSAEESSVEEPFQFSRNPKSLFRENNMYRIDHK